MFATQQPSTFITICTAVLLSITACSFQMKEGDRDRNSKYRGFWNATFQPATSNIGSACWDMAGSGNLKIAGGRVVAQAQGYDLAGFVASNGKFTTELSLSRNYKLVLTGQLDAETGAGRLIHT